MLFLVSTFLFFAVAVLGHPPAVPSEQCKVVLHLESWGFDTPGRRDISAFPEGRTKIYLGGRDHNVRAFNSQGHRRGHGYAIFDEENGDTVDSGTFDTWGTNTAGTRGANWLNHYLNHGSKNFIIAMTLDDSGENHDAPFLPILSAMGCNVMPNYREPFAFVGSTRGPQPWTLCQKSSRFGPPVIKDVRIPLNNPRCEGVEDDE